MMENLWNFNIGAPVATAREILGLLHYGCRIQEIGPRQVLTPVDRGRTAMGSLVEYHGLVQREGTIRNVLKLVDKTRLKVS